MLNRLFGAIPSMTSSRDSRKRKLRDLVDLLSLQNQPTQIQHKSKPAVHSWLNSNGWLWRCLVFQVGACLQACGWQIHVTQIFAWKPRSKEANCVPSKISTDSWIKRGNVLSDGCSDLRTSLMTKAGALYQLANWPISTLSYIFCKELRKFGEIDPPAALRKQPTSGAGGNLTPYFCTKAAEASHNTWWLQKCLNISN